MTKNWRWIVSALATVGVVAGTALYIGELETGVGDLDALAARISEDMHRWDGIVQLREVAVDGRGFVHVGVDDPAKAEPLIEEEFGSRHIKVVRVDQAEAAVG